MNWKMSVAVIAALTVGATAATAATKKHRHHVRPAPVPVQSSFEPAHFIRLPNGQIVSSYQCFTDEGYGRYRPCDASGKE